MLNSFEWFIWFVNIPQIYYIQNESEIFEKEVQEKWDKIIQMTKLIVFLNVGNVYASEGYIHEEFS